MLPCGSRGLGLNSVETGGYKQKVEEPRPGEKGTGIDIKCHL